MNLRGWRKPAGGDLTDLPRPGTSSVATGEAASTHAPGNLAQAGPGQPLLSAAEVCERAGVSYRSLDYWIRRGLFPGTAHGSGSKRRFTEAEAARLMMMGRLVRAGIAIEQAAAASVSPVGRGMAWIGPDLLLADSAHNPRKEDDEQ